MSLKAIVDRFPGTRVVVLGDLAVDCYLDTVPQRLSREAPVMILRYEKRRFVPGCAANTVMNLRALGAEVVPIGVVGDDEAGSALRQMFADTGIPDDGIVVRGRSVVKVRLMSGDLVRPKQQVLRVDFEPEEGPSSETLAELVTRAKSARGAAGIVVSDYNYGVASPELLRTVQEVAGDTHVAVDSHEHITDFHGVDLLTPNESEATAWMRRPIHTQEEAIAAARALQQETAAQAVLLTRGKLGMVLVDSAVHTLPIVGSEEIVDPSGAGDTVVATAMLARVSGATHLEAAQLATYAASVTVMRSGAATLTAAELKQALARS